MVSSYFFICTKTGMIQWKHMTHIHTRIQTHSHTPMWGSMEKAVHSLLTCSLSISKSLAAVCRVEKSFFYFSEIIFYLIYVCFFLYWGKSLVRRKWMSRVSVRRTVTSTQIRHTAPMQIWTRRSNQPLSQQKKPWNNKKKMPTLGPLII